MEFTTHPFKSDLLTLSHEELRRIASGEELKVSALVIRLEEEVKPDQVVYPQTATSWDENNKHQWYLKDKLKLVFDGETGNLKSAVVL
jgi:hypothetical protein